MSTLPWHGAPLNRVPRDHWAQVCAQYALMYRGRLELLTALRGPSPGPRGERDYTFSAVINGTYLSLETHLMRPEERLELEAVPPFLVDPQTLPAGPLSVLVEEPFPEAPDWTDGWAVRRPTNLGPQPGGAALYAQLSVRARRGAARVRARGAPGLSVTETARLLTYAAVNTPLPVAL